MAEILGLGLSHYPGPLVPVEFWPSMLRTNVSNGRIPQDLFADRARWPQPMQDEWGNDEGLGAAVQHQARLLEGYRRLRAELDAFNPDFVLMWGDDQYENFTKDCIPAFCLYVLDEVQCRPFSRANLGPFRTEQNAWGVPPDTIVRVRGHREAAKELTCHLLEEDFDLAYAYETRSERGLSHSFTNTIVYLDYELKGFPYPVVPFHVNCYGRQMMKTAAGAAGQGMQEVSPPSPSPRRCFEIGRATARFLAASPWRVAVIGSSSWSHGSLTQKHQRLYPDVEADRALYEELKSGQFVNWDQLSLHQLEDSGQNEVLNWVCLAGAMSEVGQQAEIVDFVETYVFNSSKCFAVFRPDTHERPSRGQAPAVAVDAAGGSTGA